MEVARDRTGIAGETQQITAGLALLAAQAESGVWLATQRGTLMDDFDIGL